MCNILFFESPTFSINKSPLRIMYKFCMKLTISTEKSFNKKRYAYILFVQSALVVFLTNNLNLGRLWKRFKVVRKSHSFPNSNREPMNTNKALTLTKTVNNACFIFLFRVNGPKNSLKYLFVKIIGVIIIK